MTVAGITQLQRELKLLERGIRKASRKAVNKGLTVLRRGVAAEAPVGESGFLKKSIGRRMEKSRGEEHSGKVGPGVGKRRKDTGTNAAPHAHLVALGTTDRFTRRGARRGRMPANDFVGRGFRKTEAAAADKTTVSFAEALQKELDKL